MSNEARWNIDGTTNAEWSIALTITQLINA